MKKNGNRVCVYKGYLGDCEDPDIYASCAISEYLNTEEGKWVYDECRGDQEMLWYTVDSGEMLDENLEFNMGFVVHLWCNMTDKQHTYWKLIKK